VFTVEIVKPHTYIRKLITQYNLAEKTEEEAECCKNSIIKPACLPITILALLILMTFFVPMLNEDFRDAAISITKKYERTGICTDQCRL
jgi:hypothetical protein